MNTNFFEAFSAPLKEPRGIGKLLFGGFLIILSSIFMSNLGEIFKFFISDDYKFIFTILFIIGIFIQFVTFGYCIKSAHDCIQEEFLIMPEWSHISEYLGRGIVSGIILFLYSLPFYILLFLGIFSILNQNANPILIYSLLTLFFCIEVMFLSTVLMFYFKDLKFTDAFRLGNIFKVFFRNLPRIFQIFLSLLGLSIFSSIIAALVGITIIGLLLLPSLSLLYIISSFYIIAKEGRDILWEENMWGAGED